MVVPVKFVSACAVSETMAMIATIPDAVEGDAKFTRIYYLNLQTDELRHYVDWPDHEVVSVCLLHATEGRVRAGCAMTGGGRIEIANSQGATYEDIPGAGLEGSRGLGDLTKIKEIGSRLFACGGMGQVYRRDRKGGLPLTMTSWMLPGGCSRPSLTAVRTEQRRCVNALKDCVHCQISMLSTVRAKMTSMSADSAGTFTTTRVPGKKSTLAAKASLLRFTPSPRTKPG